MYDSMSRSIGSASFCSLLVMTALVIFPVATHASDTAVTVRSADLKRAPSHSADTIIALSGGEKIEVGKRKGAWFQASTSDGITGWIRMLAVRYQAARSEGSLLGSLSKAARTKTTVATGVRGLDKEMLADAEPSHARLQELLDFPYTASEARKFARDGGLRAREAAYP